MAANTTRLYVGNLLYQVQPEEVAALFAEQGFTVDNIDMSIDPFTGRNPSYCFVDFVDPDVAWQAMQDLQGAQIRGHPLKINSKTEKRARQQDMRGATPATSMFPRKSTVPSQDSSRYAFDRWDRNDAPDHWFRPANENRRLCVGEWHRFPRQDDLNAEMKALFHGWDILAVSKPVKPDGVHRNGDTPCHCYVDFATRGEAEAARKQLDGRSMEGAKVYRISLSDNTMRKVHREQGMYNGYGANVARQSSRALRGDWRARAEV